MVLDYSKIEFDEQGRPEFPELVLKTRSGRTLGTLSGISGLTFNIKFSEPSEISFTLPAYSDGEPTPLYDMVVGHKLIYTKRYGIYVIMNPETESDGIEETKRVKGYSLEKTLDAKRFFLEEGTYNFWNPASPIDTILGRVLELASGWSVGYVSPVLFGRYRTFDEYDDYLLSFVYNTMPEKYRCVFVFDPYNMTVSAYDADEERPSLPIYLDFENLVQELSVEEISDEMVTALRPYGEDELDIRAVNPIGTNWIYDLSYFIENGDIEPVLAAKWEAWQRSVLNNQALYKGLNGLRASSTAKLLTEQAALVDLEGELQDLVNQQSVTIQAHAMEITDAGRASQQQLLNEINAKIAAKKAEIAVKEGSIATIEAELDDSNPSSYSGRIKAIVESLSLTNYFTQEEQDALSAYFIEQDITENTFVATDVDSSISGSTYAYNNGSVLIMGADILEVDFVTDFGKRMFTLAGGSITIGGSVNMTGDVIRGTLEASDSGRFVMSVYAGTIQVNDKAAASGMITITGNISGLTTDVRKVVEDDITTYEGTSLSFSASGASLYLTANVSEYQKYSVQMELFDYAVGVLSDLATPTYEFSVDSANFIFAQEFAPFRDKLELGKGIYLNIGDKRAITPILIEIELDFDSQDKFSLVFSNRFKRHDQVNTLKEMIETSYSTGRSFDASKYTYGQTVSQASAVSAFMQASIDAAVNSIKAASNQSVLINGAGIHIGGDSNTQLRIINSMIAMTDDNWATAKLAIGQFATEECGTYFGVNAEVIGGKLIVGNTLIIENENDMGVMQFRVDAAGAWLNNATFILQTDTVARSAGGKILMDPRYGIVAGTGNLFTVEGTTVTPSFIDADGEMILDGDNIPRNANFFLDLRDGTAYFRGTVNANSGSIGGWEIADDYLHSGSGSTFVALNASGSTNAAYAIWAGAENPANAPFYVKRDGSLYAKSGTFQGTVQAAKFVDPGNNEMMNSAYQFTADYLNLLGLNVNNNFIIDQNGNATIRGNIIMTGGSISWSKIDETGSAAYQAAEDAAADAANAESIAKQIANGKYAGGTFIDGQSIYSPTIYGNQFNVYANGSSYDLGSLNLHAYFNGAYRHFVKISAFTSDVVPQVVISSPYSAQMNFGTSSGTAYFQFGQMSFYNDVDFTYANVTGLSATATFG